MYIIIFVMNNIVNTLNIMPGCAAIAFSNSAKKGFLMKHFPKDFKRRKLWLVKMKQDNLVPTNYSCICEVSKQ